MCVLHVIANQKKSMENLIKRKREEKTLLISDMSSLKCPKEKEKRFVPLESGELHGQPQSFVFTTTFVRFNTDRAQSNLFYTFAFDKSRRIEVKCSPRRVVQSSRMFGSEKVHWRTTEIADMSTFVEVRRKSEMYSESSN